MTVRLTLLCHAPTVATRLAAFPADEDVDAAALAALRADPPAFDRSAQALCSPARAAMASASALGLAATPTAALRDCDYGRWRGRRLADVFHQEPDAVAVWHSDVDAAPHGGEPLRAVLARVGRWLDCLADQRGEILAITHAAILRAAGIHALGAPPAAFWRIDAPPGAMLRLTGVDGRWNLSFAARHGIKDTVELPDAHALHADTD